jgi:hypothetical protein
VGQSSEKADPRGRQAIEIATWVDPDHPCIDDLKMKDFVASVALTEEQICSNKLMRDFVLACRKISPLVEFTTRALGLKF